MDDALRSFRYILACSFTPWLFAAGLTHRSYISISELDDVDVKGATDNFSVMPELGTLDNVINLK